MKKIFIISLFLITFAFGQNLSTDTIKYKYPDCVEKELAFYLNLLQNDTIENDFYCYLIDVLDTHYVYVCQIENKENRTNKKIKMLTTITNRYLVINRNLIPIIFKNDIEYSDIMNPIIVLNEGLSIIESQTSINLKGYVVFFLLWLWEF